MMGLNLNVSGFGQRYNENSSVVTVWNLEELGLLSLKRIIQSSERDSIREDTIVWSLRKLFVSIELYKISTGNRCKFQRTSAFKATSVY
jgi:hypothetical protein